MNGAIMGLRANAQHRADEALGIWKARGKGSGRIHENFEGWQLRIDTDRMWTVYDPDGRRVGYGRYSALWVAKHEAEQAMKAAAAKAAEQAAEQIGD